MVTSLGVLLFMIKLFIYAFVLCCLTVPAGHSQEDSDFDILLIPALIASKSSSTGSTPTKPNASNTGFKPNANVQASGSIEVTQQGAVIQDLDINGCIQVKADNVVIRNVRINCGGFYGIKANFGYQNLLIEDVEIVGTKAAGIIGSDFTVRRANIHDVEADAIKSRHNVLIESSWIHRLGTKVGSHSDGVQMVAGGDVIIRGNSIDMPYSLSGYTNSQCIIIQTGIGTIDNILIESNWLNGGGYCVQINDKNKGFGPPTNVVIRNNKFGRDCQFGIFRFGGSSPQLSGNTYEDNGEPVGSDFTLCANDFE